MNRSIDTFVLVEALRVMAEARRALAVSTSPGHFHVAEKLAVAEGTLAEQLRHALPESVELKSAA